MEYLKVKETIWLIADSNESMNGFESYTFSGDSCKLSFHRTNHHENLVLYNDQRT